MNRLTPEAVDALLAEHKWQFEGPGGNELCNVDEEAWPCSVYLLASEVRDARPVINAAKETHRQNECGDWPECPTCEALAHYEEGTK